MKKAILIISFLVFNGILFGQTSEQTDQIILKLKNEASEFNKFVFKDQLTGNSRIDSLAQKYNAIKITKQIAGMQSNKCYYVIKFPRDVQIQNIIDEYYKTGEIEYAEPDLIISGESTQSITPNDQYFYKQWSLKNNGTIPVLPSKVGADIDMDKAWVIEQGDSNIIIAIIDTGNKLDHPEFSGRIWRNSDEIPNNNQDDDMNGYKDDINGWDFVNTDNDPTDDNGHGTAVSGIIGANGNNTMGYAGVDWNCKLMILKTTDATDHGYNSWTISAIYYAVDNGAKVINLSLGNPTFTKAEEDAIIYANNHNSVVVASMGNQNSSTTLYPAGYNGVIAVGATNPDDTRSNPFYASPGTGSNFGNHISVVAPGNLIAVLDEVSNTDYDLMNSGTSFSTPIVSGLATLLLAQNPARTPSQIKALIESTAEDQVGNSAEDSSGWDQYFGHGRINAYEALKAGVGIFPANNQDLQLSVFPNPTSGSFRIINPYNSSSLCEIINQMGQVVYSAVIKTKSSEINEKFVPGIYYVILKSDNMIGSRRIIIL